MTRNGAGPAGWLGGAAALAVFVLLSVFERRRPLRRRVEDPTRRLARNLAVAAVSAATLQVADRPVTRALARFAERRRFGLLQRLRLTRGWRTGLACVLLDYTLYLWHILLHRNPYLWRFHAVHHADLDLDTSTAVRFHAGELLASVGWRAGQVLVLGIGPRELGCWQSLLFLAVLFHHSNLRLPFGLERWLCRLVVTPRMHGIHHSVVPEETGSNWSSGLSVWDRLHGTLRLDVAQDDVVIGLPALRRPEEVGFQRLMALPFRAEQPRWMLPDGATPTRPPSGMDPARLRA